MNQNFESSGQKENKEYWSRGCQKFWTVLHSKLGSLLSLPFRLWPFNSTSCKLIHCVGLVYATQGAGLHNLGNTCYLNSVLQCLTYTEPFVAYLQSSKHRSSCKFAATLNQTIDIPHVDGWVQKSCRGSCRRKLFLMSALVLPADVQSEVAIVVALEHSVFSDNKIFIIPCLHSFCGTYMH